MLFYLIFQISAEELTKIYQGFTKDYPVVSIEDPFDQDDWVAYTNYTANTSVQIVGFVFILICCCFYFNLLLLLLLAIAWGDVCVCECVCVYM